MGLKEDDLASFHSEGFITPKYENDPKKSDVENRYDSLIYYCENISNGIFKRGLIQVYNRLQTQTEEFWNLFFNYTEANKT